MARRLKLLTGLSTLALTGALALAGCSGEGEAEGGENAGDAAAPATAAAEGEGEGHGEGEGQSEGEGGAAAGAGDPATDDVEYMRRLGLVRGHLAAFAELYRAGEFGAAGTHVKHPESELYAGLVPAFEARGKPGFADELEALVAAAQARENVEEEYAAVGAAIDANAPVAPLSDKLLAVAAMAKTAGDEFGIGVEDDGTISNAHEYQDAYGFLVAGREILSAQDTNDVEESEAIALAHEQLDLALNAFSGLTVERTEGKASTIYGAAARIEIAGLGLQ